MARGQICTSQANSFLTTIFMNSFIGLATNATEPNAGGGGITEPPSSAGYKRISLTGMATPSNRQLHNKEAIFMGESLGAWGTIKYVIISKTENGPVIFWAPLNSEVPVPDGHIPVFRKGALIVGIDKETLDIPTFD